MDFDDFLDLVAVMSNQVSLIMETVGASNCGNRTPVHDINLLLLFQATLEVKLAWAFKIYGNHTSSLDQLILFACCHADYNEDEFIGADDLDQLFNSISGGKMTEDVKSRLIENVMIV